MGDTCLENEKNTFVNYEIRSSDADRERKDLTDEENTRLYLRDTFWRFALTAKMYFGEVIDGVGDEDL